MDAACEIDGKTADGKDTNKSTANKDSKDEDVEIQVDLVPSKFVSKATEPLNEEVITGEFIQTVLEWNGKQFNSEAKPETKTEPEDKKTDEKTCHIVFEVGIQANDYEIERSGKIPARKRLVPFKFRDYRNPDNVDPDKSDSDYEPEKSERQTKKKSKRGRKRKQEPVSLQPGDTSTKTKKEAGGKLVAFKCDVCSKVFSQKGSLKVHKLVHTDERPFPCDFEDCDKKFRSNETLRRHKLTHMGIKPFECNVCSNKFSSKVSLTEHLARHNNSKPYRCDQCGKDFRQVSCFRRHQVTHTSALPYTCSDCGKKFSQMAYLRSHRKVHTGERPFSCDTCKKTFAHGSDLIRHKIIHSGKKPYHCPHCSHQFSDPSSCRRHVKEHQTTKPYRCNLCGDGFKRTGQLRSHLTRKHYTSDNAPVIKKEDGNMSAILKSKDHPGVIDISSLESQSKIVSLIKNLNSNIVVQHVEIAQPNNSQQETTYIEEVNMGSVADSDIIQLSQAVDSTISQLEIPIQNVSDVSSEGKAGEKTVIAITDSDGKTLNGGSLPLECTYQIIHDLAENSEEQQVYEVHYQDSEEITSKKDVPSTQKTDSPPDYVTNPDFSSQEYYNWLSSFTEVCKMVPMPLEVPLFQKMSQVHKTLSDVMATPSGVVADKDNFRVLMTISRDLNLIISEHLNFVLDNLDEEK